MNTEQVIAALELPRPAFVWQRIAKKLLIENGAATSDDKKRINEGIEELTWVASLKPNNVGIPSFRDDSREYLEIAILVLVLRPIAKASRVIELIHRAIPYPVLLISGQAESISISMANKRQAHNAPEKNVIEDCVTECEITGQREAECFLQSLAFGLQPRTHMYAFYQGWLACLDAFRAAQITGRFDGPNDSAGQELRRKALSEYARIKREIAALRSQAEKEKQLSRRVEVNLQLKQLTDQLEETKQQMTGKAS